MRIGYVSPSVNAMPLYGFSSPNALKKTAPKTLRVKTSPQMNAIILPPNQRALGGKSINSGYIGTRLGGLGAPQVIAEDYSTVSADFDGQTISQPSALALATRTMMSDEQQLNWLLGQGDPSLVMTPAMCPTNMDAVISPWCSISPEICANGAKQSAIDYVCGHYQNFYDQTMDQQRVQQAQQAQQVQPNTASNSPYSQSGLVSAGYTVDPWTGQAPVIGSVASSTPVSTLSPVPAIPTVPSVYQPTSPTQATVTQPQSSTLTTPSQSQTTQQSNQTGSNQSNQTGSNDAAIGFLKNNWVIIAAGIGALFLMSTMGGRK